MARGQSGEPQPNKPESFGVHTSSFTFLRPYAAVFLLSTDVLARHTCDK